MRNLFFILMKNMIRSKSLLARMLGPAPRLSWVLCTFYQLELEQISKLGKDKWNIYRSHLNEHIGTHLDASEGVNGGRVISEIIRLLL